MPNLFKKVPKRVIRSPSLGSTSDSNSTHPAPRRDGVREQSESNRPRPRTPPSEYEYFQPSDTPEEDWGDEEDEKEWPVKAVVGQEILQNREIRYQVCRLKRIRQGSNDNESQVEWEGWQRPDGTNTTWVISLPGSNNLIKQWDKERAKKKRELAKDPGIPLEIYARYMPHVHRTAEDEAAYYEKLAKHWDVKREFHWDEWGSKTGARDVKREELMEEDRSHVSAGPSKKKRKRQESFASSSGTASRASSSRLFESDSTLINSPISIDSGQTTFSSIQVLDGERPQSRKAQKMPANPRLNLQRQWERSFASTGAAPIRIVNDVDDEEIPSMPSRFQYLEDCCSYDDDVDDPRRNKEFLIGCECEDGCDEVESCSCLMESQSLDKHGRPSPAYDENGLYLFTEQHEVVECNENCACKRRCNNAIAQKPRKIPMEIFKTYHNGWAARSPVAVKKGTVLGLYTGKILKRENIDKLTQEERDYTFDLDARNDELGLEKYTNCAYNEGNWTRFTNHSCSPNTEVYSIVFDAPVEANMPYIAFVASKDIPAMSEITFDYNPSAAKKTPQPSKKKKGKGKRVMRIDDEDIEMEDGRTLCVCGSKNCRGYI